jgi:hypothetical protein
MMIQGSFRFLCRGFLHAWVSHRSWKTGLDSCGFCSGSSLCWWWHCCMCRCYIVAMRFPVLACCIRDITSCIGPYSWPCCSMCWANAVDRLFVRMYLACNYNNQLQQAKHLLRWYRCFSVLSENLPEDGPEGTKHVGVNEHKIESICWCFPLFL